MSSPSGPMLSKCCRTLLRQMCFGIQAYWHMCAACLFLQSLFQLFSPFLDKGPDFICHFETLKSASGLETIVLSYRKQECEPHQCFLGASLVARHPVVFPDSFLHKVRDFGIANRFRLWGLYECFLRHHLSFQVPNKASGYPALPLSPRPTR